MDRDLPKRTDRQQSKRRAIAMGNMAPGLKMAANDDGEWMVWERLVDLLGDECEIPADFKDN